MQPTEFELRRKNAHFESKVRAGKTAVKPSRQERLAKRSPISLWALGIILFVVVGGGTAGCVLAARLAEYLPHKNILLIEAGPSDFNDDRVLNLREWLNMLGGEFDYDYGTTEQPNGKSQLDIPYF